MNKDPSRLHGELETLNGYLAEGAIDTNRMLRIHRERELFTLAANGIPFISPDPRGKLRLSMSRDQAVVLVRSHQFKEIVDNITCYDLADQTFKNSLNKKEDEDLKSAHTIRARDISGGEQENSAARLDITISDTILRETEALKLRNPIIVVEYGGAHYTKPNDIEDRVGGTLLAVIPDTKAQHVMRYISLTDLLENSSLPKAVFYPNEQDPARKLLILDPKTLKEWYKDKVGQSMDDTRAEAMTRANKASYLGLSPVEFKIWEKAAAGDAVAQDTLKKLADISPEATLACNAQAQEALHQIAPGPMGPDNALLPQGHSGNSGVRQEGPVHEGQAGNKPSRGR